MGILIVNKDRVMWGFLRNLDSREKCDVSYRRNESHLNPILHLPHEKCLGGEATLPERL